MSDIHITIRSVLVGYVNYVQYCCFFIQCQLFVILIYLNTYLMPHINPSIRGHKLDGVEKTMEGCLGIGGRTMPSV
jgi:hypothetical protein